MLVPCLQSFLGVRDHMLNNLPRSPLGLSFYNLPFALSNPGNHSRPKGTINLTPRILAVITASENKPFLILFCTEMINLSKSFTSLTHPSAVSVLFFSKFPAEPFVSALAATSGAPLPHQQHLYPEKDPSPTTLPTPAMGHREDTMSKLFQPHGQMLPQETLKEKHEMLPSSCRQLRNWKLAAATSYQVLLEPYWQPGA